MRVHISQREGFESLSHWLAFLEKNADLYDLLMLREGSGHGLKPQDCLKGLDKPLILNTGLAIEAMETGAKVFETLPKHAYGLHLKAGEVQRALKRLEVAKPMLSMAREHYGLKLTTSIHNAAEAKRALSLINFDGYFVSPIRDTCCKPDAPVLTTEALDDIKGVLSQVQSSMGLIALGGMKAGDLKLALSLGLNGVAGRNRFFDA